MAGTSPKSMFLEFSFDWAPPCLTYNCFTLCSSQKKNPTPSPGRPVLLCLIAHLCAS